MIDTFYKNPDLHMHTNCSDGKVTPEELMDKVRAAGLDIFALTDHDATEGCDVIRSLLKDGDPVFIDGIEFSCEDETGKCHILGYGIDKKNENIILHCNEAKKNRNTKATQRIEVLRTEYGFDFTQEDIDGILANKKPGKPHIADCMVNKGFVGTVDEAFEILNPIKVDIKGILPELAIRMTLEAGGIPVLAHAPLGDGSKGCHLTDEETGCRVKRFTEYGLKGLECYYSAFTPEQKALMLSLAEEYNLLITAGSDYHGEGRHNTYLGNTNTPDTSELIPFFNTVLNK